MILKIVLILLAIWVFSYSAYWFDWQQWFNNFKEKNNLITGSCEKQCFIFLDKLWNNDKLNINLNFTWNWKFGYWFLIWKQVIPWKIFGIKWKNILNYDFIFSENKYFSQIPQKSELILIFEWNIDINKLSYKLIENWFIDNILLWWWDFWNMETLTPYSINLRYWVKILGTSILKYWYIIFFLFFLFTLFFKKYRKIDVYILFWLGLYLFIGFRNLITYTNITKTWLETYVYSDYENKKFFDLWDYIVFTDKVIKAIDQKKCNVYMKSIRDWPFKSHMISFYLKPCDIVNNISEADYVIYYKKNYKKNIKWNILVDYNGSYLLKLNK